MSIIKDGFCSKLTTEFDNRMNIFLASEIELNNKLKALTFGLQNVTEWSPHWAANLLKRRVTENFNEMVPAVPEEFDEIVDLLNRCLFTRMNSQLSKPSAFLRQITGAVKVNAFGILDTLADIGEGVIPEFNAAKLINELKSQIKGPRINIMIPEAMQLLTCMNAICGTDISGRMASLQTFLSKYSIGGDGELDIDALLASQGINPNISNSIKKCDVQIERVMTGIDSSFTAGLSRVKRLVPELDSIE